MFNNALRDHSMDDLRPTRSGRLITMGVDQGEVISHVVVCEWLFDRPLSADLGESAICKVLWVGRFPSSDWSQLDQLMAEFQVLYAVVDADPDPSESRRFCRRFEGYAARTRYHGGSAGNEVTVKDADSGAPMVQVDRTSWIGAALGRFKVNPTRIWLPKDIPEEFKTHIMNLTRTVEKGPLGDVAGVYVTTGNGADHFAHSLVYAALGLKFAPIDTTRSIRGI
jgi:hypothetical protein